MGNDVSLHFSSCWDKGREGGWMLIRLGNKRVTALNIEGLGDGTTGQAARK